MIRTFICRLGLGLSLFSAASMALAESQLNGLSSHTELKKEKFIGALYTSELTSDADTALQGSAPMRMEIRVVAPRLSKRRFNRMWIEGMAINSSGNTLTQQADNMVKFTGFFKKKLVTGDIVELRKTVDDETVVTLNSIELGTINNPEFFSLLLRTWIGKVPLSSHFRDEILANGDTNSELQARFTALSPSEERQQQIASWITPKEPDAVAVAATSAIAATTVAKPAPVPSAQAPKPAAPTIAAPTLAFKPQLAPPVVQNNTPEPVSPAPKQTVAAVDDYDDEEDDDGADVLTAESLLARQLYISTMLRHAYGYIKYPKRAAQRGWEGSVRLSVMVDRMGQVKSILPIEESEYSSLNKAAWKAIENAAPFPGIPEGIKGDDFEFSMPIVFRLK